MKKQRYCQLAMRGIGLIALLISLAVPAQAKEIAGVCEIQFLCTSTMHDFDGTVKSEKFTAVLSEPADRDASLGYAKVIVMVAKMDTEHRGINKNMQKMFKSGKFPQIEGVLTNAAPYALMAQMYKDEDKKVEIPLQLKIRDVVKTVTASVTSVTEDEKTVTIDMELPISLKMFSLKPASLLGLLRVGDNVTVKVKVALEKPEPKMYLGAANDRLAKGKPAEQGVASGQ